ncbi:phosphatase PAP2 family protein [Rufibacter sp. LB8]|uniref:phosphatase PAP2 family protein n=1 Tax=Rufibacter sp. LB8 TaxID=2777781 RepID=UPI00178C2E24|nr:phosphatase PAP2 family protein [Rufibacter sp. LB8]
MALNLRKLFALPLMWLLLSPAGAAAQAVVPSDSTGTVLLLASLDRPVAFAQAPAEAAPKTGRFLKRAVLPSVVLIAAGISTIKDNGFYSSYDARDDARRNFPNFSTTLDDYLFFVPIVGLYSFNLFSSQNKHDIRRQTGLVLASGLLTTAMVYPTKVLTKQERPNGLPRAFPSGHTAYAFTIATVVDKEFRAKSPWISVGSYTIASATGAMRILNNEHWLSDVLAGAGMGILSVNTVYFLHDKFVKDKGLNATIAPTVLPNGDLGMGFALQF